MGGDERTMVLWRREDGAMGGISYTGGPAAVDLQDAVARYRFVDGQRVVHTIIQAEDITDEEARIYVQSLVRGGVLWRFVSLRSEKEG